jgi:hypothetical protein
MNKEVWEQLTPKEKDKLIEERLTGKPGNYSRDWNAAMWLIGFIVDHKGELGPSIFRMLFDEFGISSETGLLTIAGWTPSDVCYIVLCALDEK